MTRRWSTRILLQSLLLVAVALSEQLFNTTPPPFHSKFSCHGKQMGFYADVEANCRVYYTCDDYGNKFTYRCPQETAFRQDALICDHAHLVDCEKTVIPGEKVDETPHQSPALTLQPPNDHRSYSRSFHIVHQPTKSQSTSAHAQPGFVLSASLFLRDKTVAAEAKNIGKDADASSSSLKVSTSSPAAAEETKLARNVDAPSTPNPYHQGRGQSLGRTDSPATNYYPYSETLRSIQANSRETTATTTHGPPSITQLPVHALTLSLKPLVPNELEYDPYYPKTPSSTEAYFTPGQRQSTGQPSFRPTSPPSWAQVHFEIPAVLPDLNTLEDLIDRRKLFYIPRLKPA